MNQTLCLLAACSAIGLVACSNGADKPSATADKTAAGHAKEPATLAPPADVAAPPATAEKSASGLAWTILRPGSGDTRPSVEDTVEVHYTGWTTDGKMFDSSIVRGRPARFPLESVIAGWTEGVQLMKVGEQRRFWIPVELAYKHQPGRPNGMLVFDVELLRFFPAVIPAPADVAAPPKDAKRTGTGLAYKVLAAGTGTRRPKATEQVIVHYTGWTADGRMFDSSLTRGEPATFPLDGVIKGWTEGVQLMVEGEKARFWIPTRLAYDNRPGMPAGMLVFDIELIKIP